MHAFPFHSHICIFLDGNILAISSADTAERKPLWARRKTVFLSSQQMHVAMLAINITRRNNLDHRTPKLKILKHNVKIGTLLGHKSIYQILLKCRSQQIQYITAICSHWWAEQYKRTPSPQWLVPHRSSQACPCWKDSCKHQVETYNK